MANKFGQTSDGKAPTFFIPASYKGHQSGKPTIAPPTSGPLSSNHVTSPTRRLEPGRSTDSSSLLGSNTTGTNLPGHVITNPGTNNSASNATRLGAKPGDSQQSSYLLASPSGVLDLSLYNFVPAQTKSTTAKTANGKSGNGTANGTNTAALTEETAETADLVDGEVAVVPKEKKRRRFRRPRRNSKLDKLIRLLEDKRVGDDDENAEELEDLQMPRLRKVLNIIFVTLGVCFLLAVIIVIMYTTIATDSDTLSEVCLHRTKHTDGCENHTVTGEEESLDLSSNSTGSATDAPGSPDSQSSSGSEELNTSGTTLTPINPHLSQIGAQSYPDMLPPPLPDLHNPPDVSISGYQSVTGQGRDTQLQGNYPYTDSSSYQSIYNSQGRDRPPYTWSNQRYSVDLNSGSIQEQLDTQDQWWPSSYQSKQ